jgi:ADP-ribose pyrophosphatase
MPLGVKLRSIEIVEDRSAEARADEGYLRLARFRLRNEYEDGSHSRVYACDVLSRPGSDAVVAALFEIDGRRRVRVLLRDMPRAPIYLRRHKRFVHPDPRTYLSLRELVAGVVEASDEPGAAGLCGRAAAETREEAGLAVPPEAFRPIGGETFASPGMSDEKLYFCAAAAQLAEANAGAGDGSAMEEGAHIVILELGEAIAACRSGDIPDMKTELGLLRLADHLGYLPQLDCFVDELPPPLRERYRRLGVSAARNDPEVRSRSSVAARSGAPGGREPR